MEPVDLPPPDRPDGPGPQKPQADQPPRAEAHERLFPGSRLDRVKEWFGGLWQRIQTRPVTSIAIATISLIVIVGAAGWTYLFAGMPRMPSEDDLWTINRKPSVQFVDATGQLVAARGPRYGSIVRAADLPPYVSEAFVAAEDQRFFEHSGVDWQSVTRAVVANVSAGHTEQGGSTLTQQLVKNTLLDDQRTLRRKAQEAVLAADMEKKLSKHEILDLYLNRVYLGSNSYGVEAAAQTYFGVPAAKLTLKQAAFLAALPKAPSRYAEHKTDKEVLERVDYVISQMVDANFITGQEARQASAEKLVFAEEPKLAGISGHVLDAAAEEAKRVMPNLPPDAVIVLTIDAALQKQAEKSLEAALRVKGLGAKEGAVVVMEPSGAVKAMVGGRDYQKSQFNRATQAHRQPGSVFKTFVYAAALEQGLDPSAVRNDAPIQIANWTPKNYGDSYRGPITLAKALAISSNSVAAQVGAEVGPKRVADLAHRFGIQSELSAYPSIALGSDEVTLLEITGAYAVLANGGYQSSPHLVAEIRNLHGDVFYAAPEPTNAQVYARGWNEMLTGMLANVVRFGTGSLAQVPGWEIAGKTGTSQSWRDAWFVGYSARYVGGVWIGNDDEKAMRQVTGGGAAAALFSKVMTAAHRGQRPVRLAGYDLGAMWLDSGFEEPFPMEDMDLSDLMTNGDDTGMPPVRADEDEDDEPEERGAPARPEAPQQSAVRPTVEAPGSQ